MTEPGTRHDQLWQLVRRLKAESWLAGRPAEAAQALVRAWNTLSAGNMRQAEFEKNWAEFQAGWEAVEVPHGHTLREDVAGTLADGWVPVEAEGLSSGAGRVAAVFAHMAAWVRVHRPGTTLFLSYQMLATLAAVSQSRAFTAAQALVDAGVLRLLAKGKRGSRGGPASEWEWLGELRATVSPASTYEEQETTQSSLYSPQVNPTDSLLTPHVTDRLAAERLAAHWLPALDSEFAADGTIRPTLAVRQ